MINRDWAAMAAEQENEERRQERIDLGYTYYYGPEYCQGRPCSTDCDHYGVPPGVTRNPITEGFDPERSHYYTLDKGEIVTPEWAQREIVKRLGTHCGMTLQERRDAAQRVLANSFWNRCTVSYLAMEARGL